MWRCALFFCCGGFVYLAYPLRRDSVLCGHANGGTQGHPLAGNNRGQLVEETSVPFELFKVVLMANL